MEDLPANSNNARTNPGEANNAKPNEDRPRVQQMAEGKVIHRKPSRWKQFTENFTGQDGKTIPQFIVNDIAAPMMRDMLFAIVNSGASRMLYGDSYRAPGPRGFGTGPMYSQQPMNYQGMSRPQSPPQPTISQNGRRMQNFAEVLIPTRHLAEDVRIALYELIDRYGWARVSDFYQAVGITANPQDDHFGWDDLRGCKIRAVGGGYIIDLPAPAQFS
jgi:hypothetical protein